VDYVSPKTRPSPSAGDHSRVLTEPEYAQQWGLVEGEEGTIREEGDQRVLEALGELRKMKEEGMIREIGISGTMEIIIPY
jgi:D-arabinose 1-dehydrogenase